MHTPSSKIEEDIEFPKVTNIKQFSEKTWEIEVTVTNLSALKPVQGVLPSDLQIFHYHLVDIHNLTPKIRGGMTFQR
jgi:hypothetical protein